MTDFTTPLAQQNLECYGVPDIDAFAKAVIGSITFEAGGPGMVLMSLLSDAQELIALGAAEASRRALNRAKFLVDHFLRTPREEAFKAAAVVAPEAAATATDYEQLATTVNATWSTRYGGQPTERVAALQIRVRTLAADRDSWVTTANANQKHYQALEARLRALQAPEAVAAPTAGA